MSPDIHLCQSLSDLRTEPVLSASRERQRKTAIAERPNLIHHIASETIGKAAVSAGRFMALEHRLACNTSPIDRCAIPTRAT